MWANERQCDLVAEGAFGANFEHAANVAQKVLACQASIEYLRYEMSATLRCTKNRFVEEIVRRGPPTAYWTPAITAGGCNGCNERGQVALIRLGSLEVRICARCMNLINEQLGAFN